VRRPGTLRPLVAGLAASLLAAAAARAEETEVSFAYVPADGMEAVEVEQPLGRLTLAGWDRAEVRIVARKHAPTSAGLDRLRVQVDLKDGRIHIRTGVRVGESFRPLPPAATAGQGIDLTVDAPRRARVVASTWAGDLEASGFRAGAELASSGGEVRARDIDGPVRSRALKGRQRLSAIRGDVEADGVTGDLELDTVDGETLSASVVEGQVIAHDVRTPVVRLFSVQGGVVFVGSLRLGGRYELSAEEGDVRVALQRGPFTLVTRAAAEERLRFALKAAPGQKGARQHGGGGPQLVLSAAHGAVVVEPR
jgi:hypothetical protein